MRSKSYVGWTPSRDSKLRRNFNGGMSDKDLATLFNCSEQAIKGRRYELGLKITDRKKKAEDKAKKEQKAQVKQLAMDLIPKPATTPTAVVAQPKHYKILAVVKGDVRPGITPISATTIEEAAIVAKKVLQDSPDVERVEVIHTVALFRKTITEEYEETT